MLTVTFETNQPKENFSVVVFNMKRMSFWDQVDKVWIPIEEANSNTDAFNKCLINASEMLANTYIVSLPDEHTQNWDRDNHYGIIPVDKTTHARTDQIIWVKGVCNHNENNYPVDEKPMIINHHYHYN